jgi:hypothetical protein
MIVINVSAIMIGKSGAIARFGRGSAPAETSAIVAYGSGELRDFGLHTPPAKTGSGDPSVEDHDGRTCAALVDVEFGPADIDHAAGWREAFCICANRQELIKNSRGEQHHKDCRDDQ